MSSCFKAPPLDDDAPTKSPPAVPLQSSLHGNIPRAPRVKIIKNYQIKGVISRGSYCTVKLCQAISGEHTGDMFAMKCYRKADLLRKRDFKVDRSTGENHISNLLPAVHYEIALFRKMKHPRCIQCHDVIDLPPPDNKLCIVTDFMECGAIMSVSDRQYYLHSSSCCHFSEDVAKCLIKDATEVHEELHIAHRDIKPQNLLMDSHGRVKIGDFGSAEYMDEHHFVCNTKGTYPFLPPECVRVPPDGTDYKGHDGKAADMWSLGITLWVMLFGILPVDGDGLQLLFESILELKVVLPTCRTISCEAEDFLKRLLDKQVETRMTAAEALSHPWITTVDFSHAETYAQSHNAKDPK